MFLKLWCHRWLIAQFFVANVNVNSDGLNVNVNRFENDNVWNAENLHRVVVPKLIISPVILREFSFPILFSNRPAFCLSHLTGWIDLNIFLLAHICFPKRFAKRILRRLVLK